MDYANLNINVYNEMMNQASRGRIAAAIPLKGPNREPMTFIVAADPTADPFFNPREWLLDPTDYSSLEDGGNYFGSDGIGLNYAMAMIHYAHHVARQNGLDQLCYEDDDDF